MDFERRGRRRRKNPAAYEPAAAPLRRCQKKSGPSQGSAWVRLDTNVTFPNSAPCFQSRFEHDFKHDFKHDFWTKF